MVSGFIVTQKVSGDQAVSQPQLLVLSVAIDSHHVHLMLTVMLNALAFVNNYIFSIHC